MKCEAPDGGIKLDGGNLNVLKKGEELSVEVKPVGSTVALWSCGWPQGCKWLSYTVFPGQHWKIIVKQPPQIVMERER